MHSYLGLTSRPKSQLSTTHYPRHEHEDAGWPRGAPPWTMSWADREGAVVDNAERVPLWTMAQADSGGAAVNNAAGQPYTGHGPWPYMSRSPGRRY